MTTTVTTSLHVMDPDMSIRLEGSHLVIANGSGTVHMAITVAGSVLDRDLFADPDVLATQLEAAAAALRNVPLVDPGDHFAWPGAAA